MVCLLSKPDVPFLQVISELSIDRCLKIREWLGAVLSCHSYLTLADSILPHPRPLAKGTIFEQGTLTLRLPKARPLPESKDHGAGCCAVLAPRSP